MMSVFRVITLCISVVVLLSHSGLAREQDEGDTDKQMPAVRIEKAPVLDGVLSPGEWNTAAVITDFHQLVPVDHGAPSQQTMVYVAYDEDFLYIAAEMLDDEPDKIIANQMLQGGSTRSDDDFKVYLSPFNNKRSGYYFKVNPNEVRNEGIFAQGTRFGVDMNWRGIWYAKAGRTSRGWVAEIAIPFKSINFDPNNDTWGISFGRAIGRTNERIAWTSYNRRTMVDSLGELVGVEGAKQGMGLDIKAEMSVGHKKNYETGESKMEFRPSLDVFYKITPSLTAVLTANTDFSAVDVDDQVVNLSRFSVFLPEKRGFFLQDSDMFRFGNIYRNGTPFFSRRIGLDEDKQPVDLKLGMKLTGRIGNWNVGMLDVVQERGDHMGDANLFVGRVSYNFLEESNVGAIMTYGDPITGEDSYTMGSDLTLTSKSLVEGKKASMHAWVQKTHTDGKVGNDRAYGGRLNLAASDGFSGSINYVHIEENFAPALGFVNREDVNDYWINLKYNHRMSGGLIQEISSNFQMGSIYEIGGDLLTREAEWDVASFENEAGDDLSFGTKYVREVLYETYEIVDGVFIAPGDYDFTSGYLKLRSAGQRRISVQAEVEKGQFYDGNRTKIRGEVSFRPTSRVSLSLSTTLNNAKTPFGDFNTRLYSLGSDIAFSANWSWITRLQYDNLSKDGGINSRLRYNPNPGENFYLVLNHGFFVDEDGRRHSTVNNAIAKIGYTFRF